MSEGSGVQKDGKANSLAALAYLFGFVSGLVILFSEKKDGFVRFHAMQSVDTFLGFFLLMFLAELIPVAGAFIAAFIGLISFFVWILLLVKALRGEKYKLPKIGEIAEGQLKNRG